ncbi:GMC oxidoreductase [Streptomyces sp. NPDC001678]|uniref:GMC oxidoreductase n=1 Tax=Streptomyces sp. NPDC001678 TaxID=3364599 RepID=UPI00369A0999
MAREGGRGGPSATTPGRRPSRFAGYDVLAQAGTWDATTSAVVHARTARQPESRFFTLAEEAVATVLFDHLLAQWDDPRVPVLEMIDARLAERQTDGWRFENMPEDDTAWRLSLRALDDDARDWDDAPFAELSRERQARLIEAVRDRGPDRWRDLTAGHVWGLWTRYTVTAFYSHPWAWNEIGFRQSASPLGRVRERNASAWLLPRGDARFDRELVDGMRRFDDRDEVDLVVGCGVGGSTVHFAGYAPRFHPSDFRTYTEDGVGADWPLAYTDLRASYERIEQELPVAGQYWPWGDPHPYPHAPHPVGGNGEVFLRGAAALGIEARVGPVAITNGRFGNRPHCVYRGFCLQGCKVNAKASTLITHVPDALAHGAEIRAQCMVTGVELDDRGRLATGVRYVREGRERFQHARTVAVAGYSIETPRLLLNSTGRRFPDGLCNDHDLVGRYVMVQGAPQTSGRFTQEVRPYKAPPPEVTSEEFYETRSDRPYRRGFSVQNVSPLPIVWAEHVAAQGHWGEDLRRHMRDYVHWAPLGALCELLPLPGNRVTLAGEKDRYGLPVAHFSYSQYENDKQVIKAAEAVMEGILRAAGASEVMTINRYAHLVGGCRMARDAEHGVVDADLRTFAVPNLLLTDGIVLPTQGSANPALTIMALVDRAAGRLAAGARAGLRSPVGDRS